MQACVADRGGLTSPAAAADPAAAAVEGLAAATEQLAHDVAEDAEVYQQSFPPSCAISLAAISCRCCPHAHALPLRPSRNNPMVARACIDALPGCAHLAADHEVACLERDNVRVRLRVACMRGLGVLPAPGAGPAARAQQRREPQPAPVRFAGGCQPTGGGRAEPLPCCPWCAASRRIDERVYRSVLPAMAWPCLPPLACHFGTPAALGMRALWSV